MLRLLAANSEFQASRVPLAISLATVPSDDVDGAGEPRWGGFRLMQLSCEELDAIQLPCEDVSGGLDWGGAGGIILALVIALLGMAALALAFWWLRRNSRPASAQGSHEIKSNKTDQSIDDVSMDARLDDKMGGGGALEVNKVQVDPYEPDGYDPNNVKKNLADLTTGEQVIKAKVCTKG